MNLVELCSTRSAPSPSGRVRHGLANVLSTGGVVGARVLETASASDLILRVRGGQVDGRDHSAGVRVGPLTRMHGARRETRLARHPQVTRGPGGRRTRAGRIE